MARGGSLEPKRKLSHWARTGLVILLVTAFSGGGAAFGQVLCIGFDGQVDLEEGANGVCSKAGRQTMLDTAQNFSATLDYSHSERCVDIEISGAPVVKESSSIDYLAATSLVTQLNPNLTNGKTRHQNQEFGLGAHPLSQAIRTTILLI